MEKREIEPQSTECTEKRLMVNTVEEDPNAVKEQGFS
jgi:hypothetical protein